MKRGPRFSFTLILAKCSEQPALPAAAAPKSRKWMMTLLKALLAAASLALATAAATLPARAVLEIDVNQGVVEPLPVAITDFISADKMGADIAAVVAADLRRSGLFRPLDKAAFIEK